VKRDRCVRWRGKRKQYETHEPSGPAHTERWEEEEQTELFLCVPHSQTKKPVKIINNMMQYMFSFLNSKTIAAFFNETVPKGMHNTPGGAEREKPT
jgi:hypothetical protein